MVYIYIYIYIYIYTYVCQNLLLTANPSFHVHVIYFLLEDHRSIMASRKPYNYLFGAAKRKARNAE